MPREEELEGLEPPRSNYAAVVLIPPLEVWEPVQAIRRAHDRQYHRWMPHVTLVYPFRPRRLFEEVEPVRRFHFALALGHV